MRVPLLLLMLFLSCTAFAQKERDGLLYGKVIDENNMPIDLVNVAVSEFSIGVTTDSRGRYELLLPVDTTVTVNYTFVGYQTVQRKVRLSKGEKKKLDVVLVSNSMTLPDAVISDRAADATSLTRLNAKQATLLPTMGGGIENLVKTLPGVISNNELSSQYTVRGGNFDENLIYVNGIEIYRPFLVGSGQQEGLSFVNSRLVNNIEFSAGGFAAEYGDKMSSVLDVTYKKPRETAGSLTLSLLGAEAHVEGSLGKDKFNYLVGARYKNTAMALKVMGKGECGPDGGFLIVIHPRKAQVAVFPGRRKQLEPVRSVSGQKAVVIRPGHDDVDVVVPGDESLMTESPDQRPVSKGVRDAVLHAKGVDVLQDFQAEALDVFQRKLSNHAFSTTKSLIK